MSQTLQQTSRPTKTAGNANLPPVADQRGRLLRDLRLSVTDHCNLRCSYCLPAEVFGPNFRFMPEPQLLSFEEMTQLVQAFASLGVEKVRITGGEPLLRKNLPDLVQRLRAEHPDLDLAVTTNGIYLEQQAQALRDAGLDRVNVSSDALDPQIARQIAGNRSDPEKVWQGVDAALQTGLEVKINAVIQRGINESQIIPLVLRCRELGISLRFIEFMDVGTRNQWSQSAVVPGRELRDLISQQFDLQPIAADYPGEVARRFQYTDGRGEVGFINSITEPFCGGCTRARVSAEGKLYTCLFASHGIDLRSLVRRQSLSDADLSILLRDVWQGRNDNYSEQRGKGTNAQPIKRAEMWTLGG